MIRRAATVVDAHIVLEPPFLSRKVSTALWYC
jgi:hypothetical protein